MAVVRAEMLISEVLASCPGAVRVFESYGLGCAACLAASMESLDAVASVHDVDVDALIADLNGLEATDCASERES